MQPACMLGCAVLVGKLFAAHKILGTPPQLSCMVFIHHASSGTNCTRYHSIYMLACFALLLGVLLLKVQQPLLVTLALCTC